MKIDGPIEAAVPAPSRGGGGISPSMKIDGPIEAAVAHWRPVAATALSVDEDRRPH